MAAEQHGKHQRTKSFKYLGPEDKIGEGDTNLVLNLLPPQLADSAFESLRKEVKWNTMFHRGGEVPRLVAVEGQVETDGSFPIYRHPADESPPLLPFSPTVSQIRQHVEKAIGHPVNHVLIQHYRSGADYISEHSDKTVDVVRGSHIVNVSLGAQRVMTLRTKKDVMSHPNPDSHNPVEHPSGTEKRSIERISLPHNSMLVMGLETNAKWMHSIRTDKRPEYTKSDPERFNNGERISLTFRNIGTFLTADQSHIYGQGAKGKKREDANPIVVGGPEAEKLIIAFGDENHQSDFDWEKSYGEGFDVLHFTSK
ncbi:Fe2OG dioxygenase domain-containing protein [Abortiporus biennis]